MSFSPHRRRVRSAGLEILCHAKAEPGNTPVIQVAPSFQATQSNFDRLHGGARQVLHDWFLETGRGSLVSNSLQTAASDDQ
jgi:dTDP-4-dehydro-6-deoxy-alpha-D-glucopyranose 2,3-dehydratase